MTNLANRLRKDEVPTQEALKPDDWTAIKCHLGGASAELNKARAVIVRATRPKPEAAFARELNLIADVTLDIRQQVESLEVRTEPQPTPRESSGERQASASVPVTGGKRGSH